MNMFSAVVGALMVGLATFDLFVTVLTTRGGGPISKRLSTWSWRAMLRLRRAGRLQPLLGFSGPVIAVLTVVGWIAMFWAGWTLIFSAAPGQIVRSTTGEPADLWARLYFTGYTLFTLGLGDYRPEGSLFQVLTALTVGNGFIVISLSASYLIPLLSAATAKNSAALQIHSLGSSPGAILIGTWDGKSFPGLSQQLVALSSMVIQAGQQHLAYPVLHHFQPLEAKAALPVQTARLSEALLLLEHGVAPQARLPRAITRPLREAVGLFVEVLERSQIEAANEIPSQPDLQLLRRAGVPVVSEKEFREAVDEQREERKKMAGLATSSGWEWAQVSGAGT